MDSSYKTVFDILNIYGSKTFVSKLQTTKKKKKIKHYIY